MRLATVPFPFPPGKKVATMKPGQCFEMFVHEENKETPLHVLACFATMGETQEWFTDFTEAKNNLLPQKGMVTAGM